MSARSNFDLSPADWQTLRRLLRESLDLAPARRAAWVDALPGELGEFKERLRGLLRHADPADGQGRFATLPRFETAAFAASPDAHQDPAGDAPPPPAIGPYRLVRSLGSGGMAAVWLAERTDMLQRRPVALKLPRAWRDAGLSERLAREREILATLDHPHIARLYDAGVAADGQPYLALEFVEGVPIDRFCQGQGLGLEARLRLFLQVLEAVAHAHARLIVHRDLKPSNILVTDDGRAKLLDFGVAKLLADASEAAGESPLTEFAGRALTPHYAAPEQILGQPIGTAADVYALGVVLYELLAGRRPYVLKRVSQGALEDAILHADVPAPSTVATDVRLRRALAGDLDTIVAKALAKAPQHRYGSVDALADDVRRTLAHEPILARRAGQRYRVRKFVRRHRLALGVAALMLLTLIAGAGTALWQAREARAAQQRAEAVKEFIAAMLRDADPQRGQGRPLTAAELLRRTRSQIERIDPRRVEVRVELMSIAGESLLNLGETAEAERVLRQAIGESEAARGRDDRATLHAKLLLTDVLVKRGATAEMQALLDDLIVALPARAPERPAWHVRALENRAHALIDGARHPEALEAARAAFALARARLGDRDPETVAASNTLADAYQTEVVDLETALAEARRALRFAEAAHGEGRAHPQVLAVRRVVAQALTAAGRPREALAESQRVLEETRAVFAPGSALEGYAHDDLAVTYRRLGNLPAALASIDSSMAILREHLAPESRSAGVSLLTRGVTRISARRPDLALTDLEAAHAVLERVLGTNNDDTLTARLNRALAVAWLGRASEARVEIAAMVDAYSRHAVGYDHYALHVQGIAARLAGDAAAALALQRRAIEAIPANGLAAWNRMRMLPEVGLALLDLERHKEALDVLHEADRLADAILTHPNPAWADVWTGIGRAQLALGQPVAALAPLRRAEAFWRDFEPGSVHAGTAHYFLAGALAAVGQPVPARALRADAIERLRRSPLAVDAALLRHATAAPQAVAAR